LKTMFARGICQRFDATMIFIAGTVKRDLQ
jgi:hypothetical protein